MNVTMEYDHIGRGAKMRIDAVKVKGDSPSKKKKEALLEELEAYTQKKGFVLGAANNEGEGPDAGALPKSLREIETYMSYLKAYEEILRRVAGRFAELHIEGDENRELMV